MSDERVSIGKTNKSNTAKHLIRYSLACNFIENKTVIDLACGTGYGSLILSWQNKKVYGVDISLDALREASTRYRSSKISFYNLEFSEAINKTEAESLVCFETLEHLKDLDRAIYEVKKNKHIKQILYSVPLNEVEGQNEHHNHVFDIKKARSLAMLMGFEIKEQFVQIGLSILNAKDVDKVDTNFTYYICYGEK